MTVLLKSKENPKEIIVIEMFDTVKEFKEYLLEELKNIYTEFKKDGEEDKEVERILNLPNVAFYELWEAYTSFNFEYFFEVI